MPGLGYQLITIPSEHFNQSELEEQLAKHTNQIRKFAVPSLRVGTLNVLISLSDDLSKLDMACNSCMNMIEKLGREIHGQRFDRANTANWSDVEGKDKFAYARTFEWKEMKYPTSRSLQDLTKLLQMGAAKMEEELRQFQSSYNDKKQLRIKAERSRNSNLAVANLAEVLTVEGVTFDGTKINACIIEETGQPLTADMFQDSQFLQTVVIVVPNALREEFEQAYEQLDAQAMEAEAGLVGAGLQVSPVVPGSLLRVTHDKDCVLYTMLVLKSQRRASSLGSADVFEWEISDSLRSVCRQKRYTLRTDFKVDPDATKDAITYQAQLDSDFNLYEGKTLEWCKVHYGEIMIAWAHTKAIRLFIESVLRYGLPPDFDAVLIEPKEGAVRKVREILGKMYGHLLDEGMGDEGDAQQGEDFYPYVSVDF
jgi:V-type H+-transporting ATPase subunit C|eukprot:Stramenopile-MAST_4_protein_3344